MLSSATCWLPKIIGLDPCYCNIGCWSKGSNLDIFRMDCDDCDDKTGHICNKMLPVSQGLGLGLWGKLLSLRSSAISILDNTNLYQELTYFQPPVNFLIFSLKLLSDFWNVMTNAHYIAAFQEYIFWVLYVGDSKSWVFVPLCTQHIHHTASVCVNSATSYLTI